jgi:hypothetical protein
MRSLVGRTAREGEARLAVGQNDFVALKKEDCPMSQPAFNTRASRSKEAPVDLGNVPATAPPTSLAREAPADLEPIADREPTADEIARLAYSYWEARGGQGGSADEDWFRAERELRLGT